MCQRNGAALKRTTSIFFFLCAMALVHGFSFACASRLHRPSALAAESELRTYIVHVRLPELGFQSLMDRESYYRSFLPNALTESSSADERMIYAYSEVIKGFAAKLSPEEVEAMKAKDGFLHAYPDVLLYPQTTYTPKFLGLNPNSGVWPESGFGNGTIIGLLDSGIWPEHPSLNASGMPPPPKKWKGTCVDYGEDFNASHCSNKLIGARAYNSGDLGGHLSPRDNEGHGTHTSTTAAGWFVPGAQVLGNAQGTATGMAPHAHLAIYRVCYPTGCAGSDILAGIDQAVQDGVDVISVSLGGLQSEPFINDPLAIGAFHAMRHGIFVSCSAGNQGPGHGSVANEAPWYLSVGASTVDRAIRANTKLGNGDTFMGQSGYQPKGFGPTPLPLVYPGDICAEGALNEDKVAGKVVLCDGGSISRVRKGMAVLKAGGAAMILLNNEGSVLPLIAEAHVLPASEISFEDGEKIKAYINSTKNPTATILFKGTVFGDTAAPEVAGFSSRGPSIQSFGILKPDIIGPGVDILAAWPLNASISDIPGDTRRVKFNMISGTSMSAPHLSGLAAVLKSAHPNWSPAAIKSAMMTTAYVLNTKGKPITDQTHGPADVFAIGAGHVNITRAAHPGLVYDLTADDYIPYLCGLYTEQEVQAIAGSTAHCSNETTILEGELNYPSFSVVFKSEGPSSFSFKRTVTNVGDANSSYHVEVAQPDGVNIEVQPNNLHFTKVNEKKSFQVVFTLKISVPSDLSISQGHIKWISGSKYQVRSPISFLMHPPSQR
ncbi:hypothetical protein AMTRI_Chr09g22350 [Amborella trichopoda]